MRGLIRRGRWHTALLALLQLVVVANIFVPATHTVRAVDRARRPLRGSGQRVAAGRAQRASNRGSGGEVVGHIDPYGPSQSANLYAGAAPAFQAPALLPPRFLDSPPRENGIGVDSRPLSATNRDVLSRAQGRAPPYTFSVLAA